MCGADAPDPIVPATPPPPPPVLEQAAPVKAAPTEGETQQAKALGTKKYRTNLGIGTTSGTGSNNSGLGIAT